MAPLPSQHHRGRAPAPDSEKPREAVRAPKGGVAQGGPIADWHQQIEQRLGEPQVETQETAGEARLRKISRAAGYSALVVGYLAVLWAIFG